MQNDKTHTNRKISRKKKRFTILSACLFLSFALAGCSSLPAETTTGQKWQEDWTQIGNFMGVDAPAQLTLQDNKDTLAADGLYYAAWVTGQSAPYENSDGEVIDLYDAQLYLLASESSDEENAKKNCQTWLASAQENYEIITKEDVSCNGQPYTLITYNCTGGGTPYDHGVSALGVCGPHAICIELICTKDYDEDLTALLTEFLNNCHYGKQD